mgnify:CR=1 FL=1
MGAFWIFAAILTFVYIVYYAVIMAMDTVGDKGKKKKDVVPPTRASAVISRYADTGD